MSMTRTPVTVAEMVNGDLIVQKGWPDSEEPLRFVGIDPLDPDMFVTIHSFGFPSRVSVAEYWQRLTKPATLCKHCGETIDPAKGEMWRHIDSELYQCNYPTYATPAEVQA